MGKAKDRLIWTESSRKKIASASVFDLYLSRRRSASGLDWEFTILSSPDWVVVVPVLRSDRGEARFLMVRQYRHGIEAVTTEFPAGVTNLGEEPAAAAARELLEETGRTAGKLTSLGKISPNPAFMNNWCHIFLAEDLSTAGKQHLDEAEVIETIEVSERELTDSLGTGEYVNSLVMVSVLWYNLRKASVT